MHLLRPAFASLVPARLGSLLLLLSLAACGGGGGGGDEEKSSTAAPATPAGPAAPATPAAPTAPTPSTPPISPVPGPAADSGLSSAQQCELADFQAELLRLVNERRARGAVCGTQSLPAAPALGWKASLAQGAARHSQDMVDKSFFSHTGSDGSSAGQRISAAGYSWSRWGENIAYGYTSSAAVVEGWMKSEGHCRNIMNAAFTEMGLACVRQSQSNSASSVRWAWTQVLATPR
ncbi:CAP domain-containing protein [Roseateles sp.]|jgi:uncharacterized protein YkwD|uniref:CAP domain-containing protein n=1 Tax=Roseateles sp. TaxID=1971397 RepID=UPI00391CB03C